jgi:hypothetical protein
MGQGMFTIAEKDATTGEPLKKVHVGNCTDLKLSQKTNTLVLKEAMTGARGDIARIDTGKECEFSAVLEDISKENLAIFLRAAVTSKVAGTVTAESVKAYAGGIIGLDNIGLVDDETLIVKSADGLTTYTKNTDYLVRTDCLEIPTTGAIATAAGAGSVVIKVDYHYGAQDHIQALTESQKEYWVTFYGLNTARSNKSVVVDIFKVSMDVLKEMALIQDKQAEINVTGSCLLDETRPSGTSPYYRSRMAV